MSADADQIRVCPNCDTSQVYRRLATEDWRCRRCGTVVDEPPQRAAEPAPPMTNSEHVRALQAASPDDVSRTRRCGCLGCHQPAVAVIDHPEHGRRTVCEDDIGDHPIIEEVTA